MVTPPLAPHPQHTAARPPGLLLVGRKARAAVTSEICGREGARGAEGAEGGGRRHFLSSSFAEVQSTLTVPFGPGEEVATWGPGSSRCGVGRAGGWGLLPPFLPCPFGRCVPSLSFVFLALTWRYWGLFCAVVASVSQLLFLRKPAQSRHTAGSRRHQLLLDRPVLWGCVLPKGKTQHLLSRIISLSKMYTSCAAVFTNVHPCIITT